MFRDKIINFLGALVLAVNRKVRFYRTVYYQNMVLEKWGSTISGIVLLNCKRVYIYITFHIFFLLFIREKGFIRNRTRQICNLVGSTYRSIYKRISPRNDQFSSIDFEERTFLFEGVLLYDHFSESLNSLFGEVSGFLDLPFSRIEEAEN